LTAGSFVSPSSATYRYGSPVGVNLVFSQVASPDGKFIYQMQGGAFVSGNTSGYLPTTRLVSFPTDAGPQYLLEKNEVEVTNTYDDGPAGALVMSPDGKYL